MHCVFSPQAFHRGTFLQDGSEVLGPHIRQVVVLHTMDILLESMVLFYTTERTELPTRLVFKHLCFHFSYFKYWRYLTHVHRDQVYTRASCVLLNLLRQTDNITTLACLLLLP